MAFCTKEGCGTISDLNRWILWDFDRFKEYIQRNKKYGINTMNLSILEQLIKTAMTSKNLNKFLLCISHLKNLTFVSDLLIIDLFNHIIHMDINSLEAFNIMFCDKYQMLNNHLELRPLLTNNKLLIIFYNICPINNDVPEIEEDYSDMPEPEEDYSDMPELEVPINNDIEEEDYSDMPDLIVLV